MTCLFKVCLLSLFFCPFSFLSKASCLSSLNSHLIFLCYSQSRITSFNYFLLSSSVKKLLSAYCKSFSYGLVKSTAQLIDSFWRSYTLWSHYTFPWGQPGMPFQLLFGSALQAQDSLSDDTHHLIPLQKYVQYEKFLCVKRKMNDTPSFILGVCVVPSQSCPLQNKFGLSPSLEASPA